MLSISDSKTKHDDKNKNKISSYTDTLDLKYIFIFTYGIKQVPCTIRHVSSQRAINICKHKFYQGVRNFDQLISDFVK